MTSVSTKHDLYHKMKKHYIIIIYYCKIIQSSKYIKMHFARVTRAKKRQQQMSPIKFLRAHKKKAINS
jgi:hypothetical protein